MACIVLVGLPGTGKSTVGRALAEVLGENFGDTDEVFTELEGVAVQDYLRRYGEVRFRARETNALRVALVRAAVVATGGGVVTTPDARRILENEFTVCLTCRDDELLARVRDGDRPLLGENPRERLAQLRNEREEWYRQVSRCGVASDRPVAQVVDELVHLVHQEMAPS